MAESGELGTKEEKPGNKAARPQRFTRNGSSPMRHIQIKHDVCSEVISRLAEEHNGAEVDPTFAEELHAHFMRLPSRYALDVNIERAQDVLIHKRLLEMAEFTEAQPIFHLRSLNMENGDRTFTTSQMSSLPSYCEGALSAHSTDVLNFKGVRFPMHEVTFSTADKPKLLSQLSALLADVGLSVWEAHIFSTLDGYSLDVFVVYGWPTEDTITLHKALEHALTTMEEGAWSKASPSSSPDSMTTAMPLRGGNSIISSVGRDDWEIDFDQLKLIKKVAFGSSGEMYHGTFCGQDVAIKVLKSECLNDLVQHEFAQEIYILRKIRHKNIVQLIGSCTKPPNLCIVTEFMPGGSVYDHLHGRKFHLTMPVILKVALDVSKGMDYLHQNNIIHRDLKTSSLLMDENNVVKVADFGVSRFQAQNGMMTAETGTYRWMAPEVIGHKCYDHKADIFSFGVILWELITGKVPYDYLSPFQVALGVLQEGLRPIIPPGTEPRVVKLLERCWQTDPLQRPEFSEITAVLQEISDEMKEQAEKGTKQQQSARCFAALKRSAGSR
ncbi:hypothetical protein O6H91_02G107800 [Diphasiastrum complanatum]|uniref:Uncharacterized protein n=1 Tax=Diphasiastrum complanatum TaxID=34168 RepID=A0ACC2EJ62_DIPCM|nr:hypothetical protein O6H91_02G107800 [Diphasiastrum complanatum]